MTALLSRLFIKDRKNVTSPNVRGAYGMLFGAVGIFLNIILFGFKLAAGMISGSIAITADALNNIADSGSSAVTLIGFKLAGKKPDPTHPFGHGRIEYISGLIVAMAILLMGFELGISSVQKIFNPTAIDFSAMIVVILAVSVAVKFGMFLDGLHIAKLIDSPAIRATAKDSISDAVTTTVVLISTILSRFTDFNADAWGGCIVALFILYSGFGAAKDTISPLLGQKPDEEFVKRINEIVSSNPAVLGVHDLIVHDYGPGRLIVSLHAEVSASADMLETHDHIDNIERELAEKLGCHAVIHMDPIVTEDETVAVTREKVAALLKEHIDERLTLHDFRMVVGPTHTNLIFDVVVPFDIKTGDGELEREIGVLVKTLDENYFAVVDFDRAYA
ncbi:MAG: cation transporter [Clostridia bacterium]|nr:cation transporter [Clostridia bacterium]